MSERFHAAPTASEPAAGSHAATEPKKGLDLSVAQVMGGALAAVTAAALGSRFGVEGTIIGTALASVIAAVASAFYTASLRRTSETVRVVLGRRSGSTAAAPEAVPGRDSSTDTPARRNRRRSIVVRSLVGAVATFAIAAGGLTLYEAVAGQAMSGGDGTTFSQVQQGGREDRPTEKQAPASSESADEQSPEPTESSDPTAPPSATSQPEPSASTELTPEPSSEPSETAEAEPSAATAPSQSSRPR